VPSPVHKLAHNRASSSQADAAVAARGPVPVRFALDHEHACSKAPQGLRYALVHALASERMYQCTLATLAIKGRSLARTRALSLSISLSLSFSVSLALSHSVSLSLSVSGCAHTLPHRRRTEAIAD